MPATIPTPDPSTLISPILPALPTAAVAKEPALGVLSLLSPILRQRVQLLSSSTEPWLRLLAYEPAKASKLVDLAQSGAFEPHPISGEVEIDWDYDAQIRYRRLDEETLQALIAVEMLGLAFQLIYCIGDTEGGGDGWRIGEVTTYDKPTPFVKFEGGVPSIQEAENQFMEQKNLRQAPQPSSLTAGGNPALHNAATEDEEDDDGYWDRYDATPAGRTPAQNHSPAPRSMVPSQAPASQETADEADYYAQYDDVQPAMDNHDPDEEAQMAEHAIAPISSDGARVPQETEANEIRGSWILTGANGAASSPRDAYPNANLLHPRPESSASSNGEQTVAKLEEMADKRGENEFSVKQHISRTIRSLWLLSRGSGIDREEFERMVKIELDLLGMVEDLA